MTDLAPEYVAARRVLLDALAALEGHLDNLILVGAQAVYHHTGDADLNVPLMTTGADLAIRGPYPTSGRSSGMRPTRGRAAAGAAIPVASLMRVRSAVSSARTAMYGEGDRINRWH